MALNVIEFADDWVLTEWELNFSALLSLFLGFLFPHKMHSNTSCKYLVLIPHSSFLSPQSSPVLLEMLPAGKYLSWNVLQGAVSALLIERTPAYAGLMILDVFWRPFVILECFLAKNLKYPKITVFKKWKFEIFSFKDWTVYFIYHTYHSYRMNFMILLICFVLCNVLGHFLPF